MCTSVVTGPVVQPSSERENGKRQVTCHAVYASWRWPLVSSGPAASSEARSSVSLSPSMSYQWIAVSLAQTDGGRTSAARSRDFETVTHAVAGRRSRSARSRKARKRNPKALSSAP